MASRREVAQYARELILQKPELKEVVIGIIELMDDEINGGGGVEGECQMAFDELEELSKKGK